jgi:S1-C subfamily serine protease
MNEEHRLGVFRRIHVRAALLALVALMVLGGGAAYAATRSTTKPVGTGVVVINTNLAYQGGAAAGTGMVLTSSGEILTNNHVVAGATTIRVVVPGTGRSYVARVLGYSTTADVAVLQLHNASNLKTVTIGDASKLSVGSRVTAVGNAGGAGRLVSARGTVTGLNRSISVEEDNGSTSQLVGLIETNAALQPGDSGGPLYNSSGSVVGMDTAASSSGSPFAAETEADGYAIPIGKATTIVKQIVAGTSSATVHVGATAFLGIQVSDSADGPVVAGVVSGGPADSAGLTAGDVITAVGGKSVASGSALQKVILTYKPGARVSVAYVDAYDQSQTTTVTLGTGPAQ